MIVCATFDLLHPGLVVQIPLYGFFDSGFKGRIGVYELLEMDDGLQDLILSNPTIDILQNYMKEKGHKNLREFGYEKVVGGVTTLEEVRQVTSMEM